MLLENLICNDSQHFRRSFFSFFEDLIFYLKKSIVNKEINNKQDYIISDIEKYVRKIK